MREPGLTRQPYAARLARVVAGANQRLMRGGWMVRRWQAIHNSTAARLPKRVGVNQRTFLEAQCSQVGMVLFVSRGWIRRRPATGCVRVQRQPASSTARVSETSIESLQST